nr:hypothetical protein CTI12_AA089470 [Tanacetum cinerariifolium]
MCFVAAEARRPKQYLILEEKFWRLMYIQLLWSHSFISFIPTYDLPKIRMCFVAAEARRPKQYELNDTIMEAQLRIKQIPPLLQAEEAVQFYLESNNHLLILVDQFKEMKTKLHPEVQEALKRPCKDPKTTIVVLSGCHHSVPDKVLLLSGAFGVDGSVSLLHYLANAGAIKKSTRCLLVLSKPIKGELEEYEQRKLKFALSTYPTPRVIPPNPKHLIPPPRLSPPNPECLTPPPKVSPPTPNYATPPPKVSPPNPKNVTPPPPPSKVSPPSPNYKIPSPRVSPLSPNVIPPPPRGSLPRPNNETRPPRISPPSPEYVTSPPRVSPPTPAYVTPPPRVNPPSPNHNEESPQTPDYDCTRYCGTEDSICDTSTGTCICHPGIPMIPRQSVPFSIGRRLLWGCQDDEICKKHWCHSENSYCDGGQCICHPCGPSYSKNL